MLRDMNNPVELTPHELPEFLLNTAVVRPVFIWGAPGIGKSALVEGFADALGLECETLLGTQLAPEDLIGVPRIREDGRSEFCPPTNIARDEPYCLFMDELNASAPDIQKACFSLIHDRRLGNYRLPEGSVVIAAGNPTQHSALVKPMAKPLINRFVHVHLAASHRDWLQWAEREGLHPLVVSYIQTRPGDLQGKTPEQEEPFSTPRSWHMLSDILVSHERGRELDETTIEQLAYGCLTPAHATSFRGFFKNRDGRYQLGALLAGEIKWPRQASDADMLYILADSLRSQLMKELPENHRSQTAAQRELAHQAKALLTDLASINLELAQQMVSPNDDGQRLPDWFLVEVVATLPRLAQREPSRQ